MSPDHFEMGISSDEQPAVDAEGVGERKQLHTPIGKYGCH
jgi:hypothetical protein